MPSEPAVKSQLLLRGQLCCWITMIASPTTFHRYAAWVANLASESQRESGCCWSNLGSRMLQHAFHRLASADIWGQAQYLGDLGCEHIVVKNDERTVEEVAELQPRGILISPGPGESFGQIQASSICTDRAASSFWVLTVPHTDRCLMNCCKEPTPWELAHSAYSRPSAR